MGRIKTKPMRMADALRRLLVRQPPSVTAHESIRLEGLPHISQIVGRLFEELFKLIFTKLYDELESGRDTKRHLVFKNYGDTETEAS